VERGGDVERGGSCLTALLLLFHRPRQTIMEDCPLISILPLSPLKATTPHRSQPAPSSSAASESSWLSACGCMNNALYAVENIE